MPQFEQRRVFVDAAARDGLRQILWGLWKKVVIADNCALFADMLLGDPAGRSGSELLIGALMFGFQIYGDFSGYSDMAIGTGRLFGFSLSQNFAYPYFARSPVEFWRRWHISLTNWFRDYVYIPLGGNRRGRSRTAVNTLVVFGLSGLWHGANWTFVLWGLLHALYLLPQILLRSQSSTALDAVRPQPTSAPRAGRGLLGMLLTFALVTLAWVMFRADGVEQGLYIWRQLLSWSVWTVPEFADRRWALVTFALVGVMLLLEWGGAG